MFKNKFINYLFYFWLTLFVLIPIALVIIDSFFDIYGHFTLTNYQTFLSPIYLKMTVNSFVIATLITIISLIIAYLAVLALAEFKHANLLLIFLIIPSWINILLKTYAFMGIFGTSGLINNVLSLLNLGPIQLLFNLSGFLIVAVYIYVPFMIFPLYNSLMQIDPSYLNAARDLGANRLTVFRKIILPLSKPGIFTAFQLAFIPSLSLFMITRLIAGNKIVTLGTAIEQHFMVTGNWPMGSTIGTILILILIIIMIIAVKFRQPIEEQDE